MKKILMFAVAALAVASQAASVKWQLSYTKDDGYAADQKVLFFLGAASDTYTHGTDTGLSLSEYVDSLLADGADAAEAKAFDTATTVSNARLGIGTSSKTKTVSYDAGTDIVGMIIVLDGNGKYSGFSFEGKVAGSGDTQLLTSNASSSTGGFKDLPGGGDTPVVPEPATGALALAGIALLFRRRKA